MGNVDGGDAEPLLQLLELDPHLLAQLGVEIGQGFIQQQDLRLAHEPAREREPLLLAAGELGRRACLKSAHAHHVQCAQHLVLDLSRGVFAVARDLERKGDVLEHRHVRPDRVGLEHHADAAVARRHMDALVGVAYDLVGDDDFSGLRTLKAGEAAQRRGLAAAGGAEQRDQLAGADAERDAVDRVHNHVAGRDEGLPQIFNGEHGVGQFLIRIGGFASPQLHGGRYEGSCRNVPSPLAGEGQGGG